MINPISSTLASVVPEIKYAPIMIINPIAPLVLPNVF